MKNYFAIFILTTAITSNSYTSFCRSAPIMQYLTEQRQLELEEARAMLLRELQATAQASAAPVQPTLTPQQQAAQEQQRQAAIAQKQAALVQAQAKRQAAKVLAQQQAAAVQAQKQAALVQARAQRQAKQQDAFAAAIAKVIAKARAQQAVKK